MIQIVTIEEVGPSLNKFYAGMHYRQRSAIKNSWRTLVRVAVKTQRVVPVESYPISIDCMLTFGKGARSYDWENASATAKMIQDGLIKCGIIDNDSLKYIVGGMLWCRRGARTMTQFAIREGIDALPFDAMKPGEWSPLAR